MSRKWDIIRSLLRRRDESPSREPTVSANLLVFRHKVLRMLNKKCVQPPLGLLTVAALLPLDWDLRLADATVRDISEEDWRHCEVVFVTGMVNQYSGIIETICQAKDRGKTVVVGGPMVFHAPEDAIKVGADIVVRGEIETAMPRLLETLERKESGIIIEAKGRPDLSGSPPPRYDLLDLNDYVGHGYSVFQGVPVLLRILRHHVDALDARSRTKVAGPSPTGTPDISMTSAGAERSSSWATISLATPSRQKGFSL